MTLAGVLYLLLSLVAGQLLASVLHSSEHHAPVEQTSAPEAAPDCLMSHDAGTLSGDNCCHDLSQGESFAGDDSQHVAIYAPARSQPVPGLSISSADPVSRYRPPIL